MDFEIFPQLLIIVSVAGILVIIGKNFSKIKELERKEEIFLQDIEEQEEREKFFYLYRRALSKFISRENLDKSINYFWLWLEKTLRKARIAFLRIDTKIVSLLQNLREKNTDTSEKENVDGEEGGSQLEKEASSKNISEEKFFSIKKEEVSEENVNDSEENIDSAFSFSTFAPSKEGNLESEENTVEIEESVSVEGQDSDQGISSVKEEEDSLEEDAELKKVRTKKEEEYIEALMKDPRDIKSYWKLGILYSKRKNYEDALACFRQIVKIDPTYTKAKQKAIELMEKMKGKGSSK